MRRRTMWGTTFAAALAAVVSATAVAPPAPALKVRNAAFKVAISGEQQERWTLDSTQYDGCIDGYHRSTGQGESSFTFSTRRPVRVRAMRMQDAKEGMDEITLTAGGASGSGVAVRGTTTRHGSVVSEQISGGESVCGGVDDPGYQPPPPDCGSKPYQGRLDLWYVKPEDYPDEIVPLLPVLQLQGPFTADGGNPVSDPFENCPSGSGADSLLTGPTGGLPARWLFGKRKRFTVEAVEEEVVESEGFRSTIAMRWTVKFTRLRTKKRPADDGGKRGKGRAACSDARDNDRDGRIDFGQDPGCSSRSDRTE